MEESKQYIDKHGFTIWYLPSKGKGYWHRLDGPAIIESQNGIKYWYVNDKLHRQDGPAIIHSNGRKEWYIDDKKLDTKEIESWLEENSINLETEEGQFAFKLKWL